jgi:hypothetical protein
MESCLAIIYRNTAKPWRPCNLAVTTVQDAVSDLARGWRALVEVAT